MSRKPWCLGSAQCPGCGKRYRCYVAADGTWRICSHIGPDRRCHSHNSREFEPLSMSDVEVDK